MVTQSPVSQGVEFPGLHVRLELTIPRLRVKGGKPLPELRKLLGLQLFHFPLDPLHLFHSPSPTQTQYTNSTVHLPVVG